MTADATLYFSAGKKVGLEWWRDGLRLQHSGWTVAECINAARKGLRTDSAKRSDGT